MLVTDDFEKTFRPDTDAFTVFVVEQRCVVGRGYSFFHSYINTSNYFDSDETIKQRFATAFEKITKSVAPVSKLISLFYTSPKLATITDTVTSLSKLFTVHEHQTAGPEIIDPIILQEGKITKRALTKLINLNKDSILTPSIIILLKDNDFSRARALLSECPDGINIKMIRNSGEQELYKVINCGANDVNAFIQSFSDQCYSTCSKTKREILLSAKWSENDVVSKYGPLLLKSRTMLLLDQKSEVKSDLFDLITQLSLAQNKAETNNGAILKAMLCIAKLFRVFCNDSGGHDILDAAQIADALNNEVLKAHVFRYAEFLPNCSRNRRDELYTEGCEIFKRNSMVDHAIYCENNKLVEQFYSSNVFPEAFRDMQVEAVNCVPGMVGLSHIFNNVGVAYLYCGQPTLAIDYFEKGLDYAKYHDRLVQNLALETNKLIAQCYSFARIEGNYLRFLLRRIFDGMGIGRLPFLTADYALNIISIAYRQQTKLGSELIHTYPIKKLISASFSQNIMGSGGRALQMHTLAMRYPELSTFFNECSIPTVVDTISGKKKDFIIQYGLSPSEFNTWL